MKFFSILDVFAILFWGGVIAALASVLVRNRYKNDPCRKYFLPALLLKFFGGIMVGVIYQYYYKNGDTNWYYMSALGVLDFMQEDFWGGISILSKSVPDLRGDYQELYFSASRFNIFYLGKVHEMAVVTITLPFTVLAFKTYYGTSIFLSAFSMVGVWGIYRTFLYHYPKIHRELAWGILFLPSLFFWGSGILKDSICLGALGIIVYTVHLANDRSLIKSLVWLPIAAISGWAIFAIKPYILLSLLGMISIWIGLGQKNKIKNTILRAVITPFLLVMFLGIGGYAVVQLSADEQRYNLDTMLDQAALIQDDLSRDYYYVNKESGGSRYYIGDFDPTPIGILTIAPVCVFFAWFRPFLWEANSIVMVAAALETMYIAYLFILMIKDAGPFGFLRVIFSDPLILFCFLFAFTFGVMVGLTSGNYGNLTRYRIPMMPFLMAMVIVVRHKAQLKRAKKALGSSVAPAIPAR